MSSMSQFLKVYYLISKQLNSTEVIENVQNSLDPLKFVKVCFVNQQTMSLGKFLTPLVPLLLLIVRPASRRGRRPAQIPTSRLGRGVHHCLHSLGKKIMATWPGLMQRDGKLNSHKVPPL